MRVIARKERPHPGAQLWITDPDWLRVTVLRRLNFDPLVLGEFELGFEGSSHPLRWGECRDGSSR